MKKVYLILLISVFFGGCASFKSASYYPEGKYPPTNPLLVQIYRNEPPRQFDVIGEAQLNLGYITKGQEDNLKKQVAAMGGDAAVCQLMQKCRDVLNPARTNVKVYHPEDRHSPRGEKEITTVESMPAQVTTSCIESTACKIIKFRQ